MKIKEIKIENFGKLSGYSKKFNDSLTAINEENGWGKSTLAAFIRVMFYGFDGEGVRNDIGNERRRYKPWGGGTYGGSLIFEANGKEYRLTRTFGSKEKEDTFALFDNKSTIESKDYSEKIGEELFQIDSDSFRKTVLFGQRDLETESTGSINAKLGNLAGATDDIDNYETVESKLDKKLNAISSSRSTGELYKLKTEITVLSSELRKVPDIDADIEKTNNSISELRAALGQNKVRQTVLEDAQKRAAKAAALLSKKEYFESLQNECKERLATRDAAASVFANGLPDEKNLLQAMEYAKDLNDLALKAAENKLSADESAILDAYGGYFAGGLPADIDSYVKKAADIESKEKQYSALGFSEQEKADYTRFSEKYRGKEALLNHIDPVISDFERAKGIKDTLHIKESSLSAFKKSGAPKTTSILWIILLGLGVIVTGAGIAMLLAATKAFAMVVLIAGGALIAGGVLAKVLSSPVDAVDPSVYEKLESEIESDLRFLTAAEKTVSEFLGAFSVPFDYSTAYSNLLGIKTEYQRYGELLAKEADTRDDALLEEINKGKQEIYTFIAPFESIVKSETDIRSKLQRLMYESQKYTEAKAKADSFTALANQYENRKAPLVKYIEGLGFGVSNDLTADLNRIAALYGKYKTAAAEYKTAESKKAAFESENDMAQISTSGSAAESESVDEINSRLSMLSEEKERLISDINTYGTQLQSLLEEKDALDEKSEALKAKSESFEYLSGREVLLGKTKALLEKSKINFLGKYSKPVADGFKKYYELIEGKSGDEYSLSYDMKLRIEDHGGFKDLHAYSAGSQDKIELCFRIALIEAMYNAEKPVIIMDDPFTELDRERIEGGIKMLDVLKKDYQIIYLTCHESRMPK